MPNSDEEYLSEEEDNPKQSSTVKKEKLRTKSEFNLNLIYVQDEFLADLMTNLTVIKKAAADKFTKAHLRSKKQAFRTDMDDSIKYHKNILFKGQRTETVVNKYFADKTYTKIRNTYSELIGEIDERLGESDISTSAPKTEHYHSDLNLPRLELPTFTGKYEEWLPFHNLFMSSVDSKSSLDPVQKLHYLMKSVTGDAYCHIKNLSLTADNYQKALDLLDKQFNHTRKVAHTYMKKLLDIKQIVSENAKDLRNFISNTKDCMISLEELGLPVKKWDYILLYVLQTKIPQSTYLKWEEELGASREIPKFDLFLDFLEKRYRTLEMVEVPEKDVKKPTKALHTKPTPSHNVHSKSSSSGNSSQNQPRSNNFRKQSTKNSNSNSNSSADRSFKSSCSLCNGEHAISKCRTFLNNTPVNRSKLADQYKLCSNCLGPSHSIDTCYSLKTCIYCHQQHHSLLHVHERDTNNVTAFIGHLTSNSHTNVRKTPQSSGAFYASTDNPGVRVLGTALVRLINSSGFATTARALLDSGAEENYITNSTVNNTGLQKYLSPSSITGLNDVTVGSVDHKVNFRITSLDGSFEYDTNASVVETITSKMPSHYVEPENFGSLNDLPLADPNFNHPGKIQLLLGIGFIVRIRQAGFKKFNDLMAEETLLGWVIMGQTASIPNDTALLTRSAFLTKKITNEVLSEQIQRFFEIEEFAENIPEKPEDTLCEQKFTDSVKRCTDGRLCVDLPFRDEDPIIGPSKHIAMRRFLNMEKKLEQNLELKEEYHKTFTDYLRSGHLVPVTVPSQDGREYFLPHHSVFKESSTTTKVRVVFDGSCKSADCTSLNDHLLTGPKLQTDIRDVFFNWRTFKYALTADIAKMYRMFWISEKHRPYQKVLWRFNKHENIREYSLATVTFGTSSAPFQAIRCLKFIADQEFSHFPLASKALHSEFYVDDFISGAHSLSEAIQKQTELRKVLLNYGLNIRKWSSNCTDALNGIITEELETLTELRFEEEEFKKTLGVFWAPKEDFFSFSTDHFAENTAKFTKRNVLSLISRLYDPVGWVGPCTLRAKMIMQRIWGQQLAWDDEVCGTIKQDFETFLKDLAQLTNIKFPRWIKLTDDVTSVTLYGFSDASLDAYGAVVYLKNPDITDPNKLILLTSRTRVKPLKHITLARLELCAAVMLAELLKWASELLKPRKVDVLAFSDSKIVLSWLNSHPSRWKMYVAGRTSKILENMTSQQWSYVNTKHNPADYASRGLMPSEIVHNSLWWNGPDLANLHVSTDHISELTEQDKTTLLTESKTTTTALRTSPTNDSLTVCISKFSSHGKMCRVMSCILTFLRNILLKVSNKLPERKEDYLPMLEKMRDPEIVICRLVQRTVYLPEIKALESKQPLPRKSSLLSLAPFVDGFGLLRIGGRLQNSYLPYNQKHPIILPYHHQVSTNLIRLAHHATLHGLNTTTAAYLRHKFHIIRGTDRIKSIIRSCPKCVRFARQSHEQLMGSLPKDRVNMHRAFLNSGVDYAGPFTIKAYKGRCKVMLKCYVALFVCFTTKAIHLEVVSDLTATSFIAAFRRFVNRRGRCQKLYSDRGTNFVKGDKLLTDEVLKAQLTWKSELEIDFQSMGTVWAFNPPGAPHFGGIWEAGVKSMKSHLYKIVGNALLTLEEFNTLLIQIEGILNSRPLCRMSSNPNDFTFLTPAHFLIGESIVAPPERAFDLGEKRNPHDRWQYVQKLRQSFWVAWCKDYLHRLTSRPKWQSPGIEFRKDDLVLLTDENNPPIYWPMAIILETHPGRDGITRVVTIRTQKGQIFQRPTAKLRLLPYDQITFESTESEIHKERCGSTERNHSPEEDTTTSGLN